MDWKCAKCGVENKSTFKFCFSCGEHRIESNTEADAETSPHKAAEPIIRLNPKVLKVNKEAPQFEKKSGSSRPVAVLAAKPNPTDESGWRCHECWKLNADTAIRCDECGTAKRASARADRHDRVFGVFGAIGKWPVVILFLIAVGGSLAWLYYYLNPKHGDVIGAPAGLESAIRASLDQVTAREIESSTYYNCYSTTVGGRSEAGGYASVVTLVPMSTNVSNTNVDPNRDRNWQLIAHRDGYTWKVERFAIADPEGVQDPCVAR